MSETHDSLYYLSQVVGWIYFVAWSISFYGQVYENWKQKKFVCIFLFSVEGYSLKFQILNFTGFTFYSVYSTYGYFYSDVQTGQVEISDVFFAYHAFLMVTITGIQCIIYPKGANQIGMPVLFLNFTMWAVVIILFILDNGTGTIDLPPSSRLHAINFLGYGKLLVSFLKYCPQAYRNYVRKSTIGWSIFNIIMDFTGGSFSLLQIIIDAIRTGNSSIIDGSLNVTKFALSIIAMVFDILFMIQHYILYRKKDGEKNYIKDNLIADLI